MRAMVATSVPSPRRSAGAAYLDDILLVGGELSADPPYDEMWRWTGAQWTPQTSTGLVVRREFGMTASTDRLVLFGGVDSGGVRNDTWEWDGTSWSSIAATMTPSARRQVAMSYDPVRKRAVLFGGFGDGPQNDTWEWDGTTWTQTASGPPGRSNGSLAYDSLRRELVMFGGQGGSAPLGDTWTYRYERAGAVDESCVAGQDTDVDGLAGCDDTDCWGYCTPLCPPDAPCDPASPHCGDGVCNPHLETAVCPADC